MIQFKNTKIVMQTLMYLLLSHLLMAQDKFCNSLVYIVNVKNVTEPRHEKTNVVVSDLVLHKPGCIATEDG